MTILEAAAGFAVLAALLTIIPGLDTALVLRSSLTRSRGYAYATAGGIQVGVMVWGVAAATGASLLLAASEVAYEVLSIVGAGYLVFMGVRMLVTSFRAEAVDESGLPAITGGNARGFATGAVTNLLNPKVGVFYLATIPQFVPAGVSPLLMGALLALVHVVLAMIWYVGVIQGSRAIGARLRSPRFVRGVDRVTGGVLVVFGVKLALDTRF